MKLSIRVWTSQNGNLQMIIPDKTIQEGQDMFMKVMDDAFATFIFGSALINKRNVLFISFDMVP